MTINDGFTSLKVATIVGTRPEIIRLSCIIKKLDKYFDHILINTGQNYDYELNKIFFNDLEIRNPDYFLECAGSNPSETISEVISNVDKILESSKPDAVLILGDTNSALSAIPAKRRKIPIFHMEAGNRCFDMRVPEEINRKIVDHISDINLPYSDIAREHLIREGIRPDTIIKTGSPMDEVLIEIMPKILKSTALEDFQVKELDYFLVSLHREENVDSPKKLKIFIDLLDVIANKYNKKIIFSTHPRTRNMIDKEKLKLHKNVFSVKPIGFVDYISLQKSAYLVLSDSGTITEESSILNFPAINLRDAHERPEGMEEGSVMFTGLSQERILNAIEILSTQKRGTERNILKVSDYHAPNVSEKIARIILSYTDFINREIWKKY